MTKSEILKRLHHIRKRLTKARPLVRFGETNEWLADGSAQDEVECFNRAEELLGRLCTQLDVDVNQTGIVGGKSMRDVLLASVYAAPNGTLRIVLTPVELERLKKEI